MNKLSLAVIAAASLAMPAMAQTTGPHNRSGTPAAASGTTGMTAAPLVTPSTNTGVSARTPVFTDNGDMRTSKIVGSSVYNEKGDKIGSVDDVVVGKDKSLHAILSVGGFLGMGDRLVEVPFDRLQFGDKDHNNDRVVLPGATKDSLKSMAEYHYTAHA